MARSPKTVQRLSARVAELAALAADDADANPEHAATWEALLTAALLQLNGVARVQSQRRLVRKAVRLASTEGEPSSWAPVTDATLLQRARAAALYVRDAHPQLGAEMLAMVAAAPRVLVDALRAHGGRTGRRRRGDTRPSRPAALAKLFHALQLGGHESQIRRRGALELP